MPRLGFVRVGQGTPTLRRPARGAALLLAMVILSIVATEDDTTVTVDLSALVAVVGGGGIDAIAANGIGTIDLDRGDVAQLIASPLGQIALYLLVAAMAYHLANGLRHLVFDTGAGLTPSDADTSAWFAILFAFAAPIGLWALLTFGG